MKNTTVLMAAVLAAATILAAGLVVVPNSVHEAQANPCATEAENEIEVDTDGDSDISTNSILNENDDDRECNFVGPVELDED